MTPKLLLFVGLLGACVVAPDADDNECTGGKCDGQGNSCSDKRYDDGVCDPQIECAVPDIDCFQTFEDDESAAAWYSTFEVQIAAEQHREPHALLSPEHPLWASTRKLLDDGWDAFRANRPVGRLNKHRPALVLVDNPEPNAFVVPDLETGKAGFAVMVNTGLFSTGASDDGAFGVMMHEFQHVVGLHIVADTKDRLRTFYFASATHEPIGTQQSEDATARDFGTTWRTLADEGGRFHDERLRALPMGGQLMTMLRAAFTHAGTMEIRACSDARAVLSSIANDLAGGMDSISGEISVGADIPARVDSAMATVATACFAGFTPDLIEVVAQMVGQPRDVIEGGMSADDIAMVKGKPIIDGFSALLLDRRAKLRQLEALLPMQTGRPWSALRYFSAEEDADDVSVTVLRAANVEPPHAIGEFFVSFLDAEGQERCKDLLARGVVPPYGADLVDEHHGSCWRAHHVRQFSESRKRTRRTDHSTGRNPIVHTPLPIPRPLSELVMH